MLGSTIIWHGDGESRRAAGTRASTGIWIALNGKVNSQSPKQANLPKENRILYHFHIQIVEKSGKAKRKQISQKITNPKFICGLR